MPSPLMVDGRHTTVYARPLTLVRGLVQGTALKARVPLPWRKHAKWARVRLAESLGSTRFSHPSLYGLERSFLPLLPEAGVFLEVGANDGYDQSNTYFLERHLRWQGILVEPLDSHVALCRRRRPRSYCVWAACVPADYPADEVQLSVNDLMTVSTGLTTTHHVGRAGNTGRSVSAPARTLSSIIDESPFDYVDFMSIDVEGAERAVLHGLDLCRHRPGLMLIETDDLPTVREVLEPWMQLIGQPTFHDYLFRSREHPLARAAL